MLRSREMKPQFWITGGTGHLGRAFLEKTTLDAEFRVLTRKITPPEKGNDNSIQFVPINPKDLTSLKNFFK